MLSPAQALQVILRTTRPLAARPLPLAGALGRALARDVRAPYDYPLFDNAALDGYAVRWADTRKALLRRPLELRLAGSQFAGPQRGGGLKPGQAWHVTTGGAMPAGADALVPYEAARREGGRIWLVRPALRGQNVRRRGEDARRGALLARKGELLHARRLAMLAAFGVERAWVAPAPRVAVAVSGDELTRPGRKPRPGQVFDSNTPALAALLAEAGLAPAALRRLPDQAPASRRALAGLLKGCDVLLVAGGMSVGQRDLGKPVLESLGVKRVFWKVAQKPGKPLYFGLRGRQLVFGLPGNPAAVATCFHYYVLPALRRLAGLPLAAPASARLAQALPPSGDKALFLKAQVQAGRVHVLGGQGSHLLRSLAEGNALLLRPAGDPARRRGASVKVLPLPPEGGTK